MYSEKQLEYSDLILSTLYHNGGKMRESDVCDVLDDKYGEETVEPALQIQSLIETEGMIVRRGTYLVLTDWGRQAAETGFSACLDDQGRRAKEPVPVRLVEKRFLGLSRSVWYQIIGWSIGLIGVLVYFL